jgi:hypothetical protein
MGPTCEVPHVPLSFAKRYTWLPPSAFLAVSTPPPSVLGKWNDKER